MTNKRKKRIKAIRKKTGLSHQGAHNQLQKAATEDAIDDFFSALEEEYDNYTVEDLSEVLFETSKHRNALQQLLDTPRPSPEASARRELRNHYDYTPLPSHPSPSEHAAVAQHRMTDEERAEENRSAREQGGPIVLLIQELRERHVAAQWRGLHRTLPPLVKKVPGFKEYQNLLKNEDFCLDYLRMEGDFQWGPLHHRLSEAKRREATSLREKRQRQRDTAKRQQASLDLDAAEELQELEGLDMGFSEEDLSEVIFRVGAVRSQLQDLLKQPGHHTFTSSEGAPVAGWRVSTEELAILNKEIRQVAKIPEEDLLPVKPLPNNVTHLYKQALSMADRTGPPLRGFVWKPLLRHTPRREVQTWTYLDFYLELKKSLESVPSGRALVVVTGEPNEYNRTVEASFTYELVPDDHVEAVKEVMPPWLRAILDYPGKEIALHMDDPLKPYFEAPLSCPRTINRFPKF